MVSPLLRRFLVPFNLQSAICGMQSAVCKCHTPLQVYLPARALNSLVPTNTLGWCGSKRGKCLTQEQSNDPSQGSNLLVVEKHQQTKLCTFVHLDKTTFLRIFCSEIVVWKIISLISFDSLIPNFLC